METYVKYSRPIAIRLASALKWNQSFVISLRLGAMCCNLQRPQHDHILRALAAYRAKRSIVDSSVAVQEHHSRDSSVNRELFSVISKQVWVVVVLLSSEVQRWVYRVFLSINGQSTHLILILYTWYCNVSMWQCHSNLFITNNNNSIMRYC